MHEVVLQTCASAYYNVTSVRPTVRIKERTATQPYARRNAKLCGYVSLKLIRQFQSLFDIPPWLLLCLDRTYIDAFSSKNLLKKDYLVSLDIRGNTYRPRMVHQTPNTLHIENCAVLSDQTLTEHLNLGSSWLFAAYEINGT